MASGQQIAKENLEKFQSWITERNTAGDWIEYIRGNKLNRTEIAKECRFALSVLRQNPNVRKLLLSTEIKLVNEGILKQPDTKSERPNNESNDKHTYRDKQRLNQLEQENQTLQAENDELKDRLELNGLLDDYLKESGRLPR